MLPPQDLKMKHAVWLIPLFVVLGLGMEQIRGLRCGDALAAPPLTLTPDLLSEGLPEAKPKEELKVDNSSCYVCHGNMDGEELVVSHGMEGTSCIDCHGASLAHRNDEDNITPPDIMYASEGVDPMCGKCHDIHEASARKVIERWQERCPAKTDPKQIICTDCHYQHRLAFRSVQWDKKTGALMIRKVVEEDKTSVDSTGTGESEEMQ
jgi:hypothetical protein